VLGLNGTTLTSLGWTRAILAVNIVAAVANIVLNLYLIPRYSLIGAAVATTLSYVLINALYSSVLYVRTGIVPARRPILLLSVMISPIAFAVYRLSQGSGEFVSWVSFLVFVVAYTALFVRIVGVSDEAKDIISDVVRRYRTG
jgi:O-antigen/teichoic acid export membrane protein